MSQKCAGILRLEKLTLKIQISERRDILLFRRGEKERKVVITGLSAMS